MGGMLPNMTSNSFFSGTQMSGFGVSKTAMDELTSEQLLERLMVAETIMKKLYNRNKELEKWYEESKTIPEASPPAPPKIATCTEIDVVRPGDVPDDIMRSMKER